MTAQETHISGYDSSQPPRLEFTGNWLIDAGIIGRETFENNQLKTIKEQLKGKYDEKDIDLYLATIKTFGKFSETLIEIMRKEVENQENEPLQLNLSKKESKKNHSANLFRIRFFRGFFKLKAESNGSLMVILDPKSGLIAKRDKKKEDSKKLKTIELKEWEKIGIKKSEKKDENKIEYDLDEDESKLDITELKSLYESLMKEENILDMKNELKSNNPSLCKENGIFKLKLSSLVSRDAADVFLSENKSEFQSFDKKFIDFDDESQKLLENNWKFFNSAFSKTGIGNIFIHHQNKDVCAYVNSLIKKESREEDWNKIIKKAIIQTLVKYGVRAPIGEFSIIKKGGIKKQRLESIQTFSFKPHIINYLASNPVLFEKRCIIGWGKKSSIVEYLPFAINAFSPARLIQILFSARTDLLIWQKKIDYTYALYELNLYSEKQEKAQAGNLNPFSHKHLRPPDGKNKFNYSDFSKIAGWFSPQEAMFVCSCVRGNQRKKFLDYLLKKIFQEKESAYVPKYLELYKSRNSWLFLAAFIFFELNKKGGRNEK